jgi:hypothetical protein
MHVHFIHSIHQLSLCHLVSRESIQLSLSRLVSRGRDTGRGQAIKHHFNDPLIDRNAISTIP